MVAGGGGWWRRRWLSPQMQRMADLNLEVVPFDDILSQM